LLNILDGIQESNGRIIIMTTNKPEILDKALIRPGRIDIEINFKKASIDNIKEIIENFFGKTKDLELKKKYDNRFPHCVVSGICRISDTVDEVILRLSEKTTL
jgi:ATP-dependent 26S proteasome regulatory subunit